MFIITLVDLPYNLESKSVIKAKSEWRLIKEKTGELSSHAIDHFNISSTERNEYLFDRGEIANIDFPIKDKKRIEKGDTIIKINSTLFNEKIITLKNQIAIEKATLNDLNTGQKRETISEHLKKIELAKKDLEYWTNELNRIIPLYEKDLVSQADYARVKINFNKSEYQLNILEETLMVLTTGEKDETIDLIKTKIDSYQDLLDIYQNRINNFNIIAPFSGEINYNIDTNCIVQILNTEKYIIKIPVRVKDYVFVQDIKDIEIKIDGYDRIFKAKKIDFDRNLKRNQYEQYYILNAELLNPDSLIRPELIAKAKIKTGHISFLDYFKRTFDF